MITYLFIGGIVLLGIEAVVPGTCIFGVSGMVLLLAALYFLLGRRCYGVDCSCDCIGYCAHCRYLVSQKKHRILG